MTKLTLSEKLSRLRERLHDREWRRYGMLLLTGKLMALGLLVVGIMFVNPGLLGFRALAADPALTGNDIVNPLNTVWSSWQHYSFSVCRSVSRCSKPASADLVRRLTF